MVRHSSLVTLIDKLDHFVLDAYRACEFATLATDGTPLAWPASPFRQQDDKLAKASFALVKDQVSQSGTERLLVVPGHDGQAGRQSAEDGARPSRGRGPLPQYPGYPARPYPGISNRAIARQPADRPTAPPA